VTPTKICDYDKLSLQKFVVKTTDFEAWLYAKLLAGFEAVMAVKHSALLVDDDWEMEAVGFNGSFQSLQF
jgi:hypothetical protein